MNKKIGLYGNIVLDHIYEVDQDLVIDGNNQSLNYKSRLGGIMNVLRELDKYDYELHLNSCVGRDIRPDFNYNNLITNNVSKDLTNNTSSATIIINKKQSTRTSVVNWAACRKNVPIFFAGMDWHHISYLDALPSLSIEELSLRDGGVISADLCGASLLSWRQTAAKTAFIDFLFMSSKEYQSLKYKIDIFSKNLIIHDPTFCTLITSQNNTISVNNNYLVKNICPLGAGDIFAANFINNFLSISNTKLFGIDEKFTIQILDNVLRNTSKSLQQNG